MTTNKTNNKQKSKVADIMAARVIDEMKNGTITWLKPWFSAGGAISRATGKPYGVMNGMFLKPGEYATIDDINKEGGSVNKGAKSSPLLEWFPKKSHIQAKDENGDPKVDENGDPVYIKTYGLRYIRVFNIEKDTNLKPKYTAATAKTAEGKQIDRAEKIINAYVLKSGVSFQNDEPSNRAFYSPVTDTVVVPMLRQYKEPEEYYSTTFHELGHSTGTKERLNRKVDSLAAFGSKSYSKEELVAELTACTICNRLGIETKSTFRNSAAYLQGWLAALENDSMLLFSAASLADKAVKMIMADDVEAPATEEPEAKTEPETEKTPEVKEPETEPEANDDADKPEDNPEDAKKMAPEDIKLKRGSFLIATPRGYESVNGYTFQYNGIEYGIHRNTPQKPSFLAWNVTHLSTGLAVCAFGSGTRKQALHDFIEEYEPRLQAALSKNPHQLDDEIEKMEKYKNNQAAA